VDKKILDLLDPFPYTVYQCYRIFPHIFSVRPDYFWRFCSVAQYSGAVTLIVLRLETTKPVGRSHAH